MFDFIQDFRDIWKNYPSGLRSITFIIIIKEFVDLSSIIRKFSLASLLCVGVSFVSAQEVAHEVTKPVAFRHSQVEIKAIPISTGESSEPGGGSEEMNSGEGNGGGQQDVNFLTQKKEALETRLREERTKLNGLQGTLDIQTASHNFEKADATRIALKDQDARVKADESQLSEITKELQGVMQDGPEETEWAGKNEVLVPGDNLELFVVEDSSFNSRYQVRRGGYIILPAVGRVSIAGKVVPDAEKAVKKALESSQLKNATVMIERIQGKDVESGPVVFLAGGFQHPGRFQIPSGTKPTLVTCILSCGGVTSKADLTHVKVMRVAGNKGVVEDVNVAAMIHGGGLGSDLTLEEGDVVMVPGGAENVVYLTGNVRGQGSFNIGYWDKLGAYSAILQRGGFARFADLKRIYILRATPDGTKIRIPLNVTAIQKGRAPDVDLQPNDIVVVPEKFFSF